MCPAFSGGSFTRHFSMVWAPMPKSAPARTKKPPLTDTERHHRFKDMAREVEAGEDPEAFERAFASVVAKPKPKD